MTQGPDYIFLLHDENRLFYRRSANGELEVNPRPYCLEYSPAGWDDIAIQNVRNRRLWGVDRTVTVPLSYVKDGADILKDVIYEFGHEKTMYLVICKQELEYRPGVSYNYWYRMIFKGEVDASTFDHHGAKVTCNTVEDGLPKYLKANENTIFELDMNVPEARYVKMDGVEFLETLGYSFTDSVNYINNRYVPSVLLLTQEGDSPGIVKQSQYYEPIAGTAGADETYVQTSDNYFYGNESPVPVTIRLVGVLKVRSPRNDTLPLSGSSLKIKTNRDTGGGTTVEQFIFNTFPLTENVVYTIDVDQTITLQPGEHAFFFGNTLSVNTALYEFEYLAGSKLNISFTTRRAATYVRHLPAQYIFDYLIRIVTEGAYTGATSTMLAAFATFLFTSGDAIRGFDTAKLKISLGMFFQFWDCWTSAGITELNRQVIIESRVAMTDTANAIPLPAPAADTFRTTLIPELFYNEVQIGYPEIKNEIGVLNGNEEWNCKWTWTLLTMKRPAVLEKVSKIKASCYEQEKIRVTTLGKNTTDNKGDNDVFVNHVLAEIIPATSDVPAHQELDRTLNATATGLIAASTVWNLGLSPKRMLYNNGPELHSRLYKCQNKILQYANCDKNNKVVAGGIVEKANTRLGDLGGQYYLPWMFYMEVSPPDNLLALLDVNPLQVFSFPFVGVTWYGILDRASIAPSSRKLQSYQLIATAGNDMTLLKDYEG